MRRCVIYILMCMVLAAGLTGCGRSRNSGADIIWETDGWRATLSGMTEGATAVTALPDSVPSHNLKYFSQQPVIDRMFNDGVAMAASLSESWNYPVDEVTDAIPVIALVDPDKAMEMLRVAADRCTVTGRYWPLEPSHAGWVTAAWQVYLATADEHWLEEAYTIGRTIFDRDFEVAFDHSAGLFAALDRGLSMGDYSLTVNVVHARATRHLAEMAAILGDNEGQERYSSVAEALTSTINDRFWIPQQGRYGSRLTGNFYPTLVTDCDNRGQALAILGDVATPEMASSAIASTPLPESGIPEFFPAKSDLSEPLPLQSLWAAAARKVRNENAMLFALGSSMRLLTSDAARSASPASCRVALTPVLKILFGISFTAEGLVVRPVIPSKFPGTHRLTSLDYRDMTLDITVSGTGDRIARFEIDGEMLTSNTVPADLTGRHEVTVTMANNEFAPSDITFAPGASYLVPPVMSADGSGEKIRIANFRRDVHYSLAVNGVESENVTTDLFSFEPDAGDFTVASLSAFDDFGLSSAPSPPLLFIPAADSIIIAHTAIPHELRKSVIRSRERRRRSRRKVRPQPDHLEMTRTLNTELTVGVVVRDSADYFISVGYWRPLVSESLLTDLTVNSRRAGTFVMDSHKGMTNVLSAPLRKGYNRLRLIHRPLPAESDDGGACLEYIRLIRKP